MNDFGAAIDQALGLEAQHADAVAVVEQLSLELARAVGKRTQGVVRVELLGQAAAHNLAKQLGTLFGARPMLGTDAEDRIVRKYLIARRDQTEARALWDVEFSETGYPVKVRGPRENQVQVCFSEADVRAAFFDAAADVRVGRKLKALLSEGSSEAPQQVTLRDTSTTSVLDADPSTSE